ncbi:MAG: hypothetical protein EA349_04515 [Halomonadaceae bacterium]|nr:MAG: hypothetical protein EA349_04515 [Halomonadaceae bacterium]
MSDNLAPQYTDGQRRLFVFALVTVSALLILGAQFWLFPQLQGFSAVAHCYDFFGVSGPAALLYGILSGLPLLLALTLGSWFSWRGLRISRARQSPLPGEKVFQSRPYVTGDKAAKIGVLHHLPMVLLLAFALWGAVQAQGILAGTSPLNVDYSLCSS